MKVVLDAYLQEQTGCLLFLVEPRMEDRLKQKDVPVERSILFYGSLLWPSTLSEKVFNTRRIKHLKQNENVELGVGGVRTLPFFMAHFSCPQYRVMKSSPQEEATISKRIEKSKHKTPWEA